MTRAASDGKLASLGAGGGRRGGVIGHGVEEGELGHRDSYVEDEADIGTHTTTVSRSWVAPLALGW